MNSAVKFTWERKTSRITCLTTHLLETCMSTVKFLPLIIFALVFHNLWNAVWFQFLCLYRVMYLGTRLTSQLTDRGQPVSLFCLAWLIRLVDLFLETSPNISHCQLFIANISHGHTDTDSTNCQDQPKLNLSSCFVQEQRSTDEPGRSGSWSIF